MGFYVQADNKTKALKKARGSVQKSGVVTKVSRVRGKPGGFGSFYATTKTRRGF